MTFDDPEIAFIFLFSEVSCSANIWSRLGEEDAAGPSAVCGQ